MQKVSAHHDGVNKEEQMERVQLQFPLNWEYKIIATKNAQVFDSLCHTIKKCGFTEQPCAGNISKNGAYITYTLSLLMETQEQLDQLTQALHQCRGVKFLL
jgi:putative lipoic acid-binding regulatory protein